MSKVFGAYIHAKPDGVPFYVGKGTKKRMRDFYTARSNWHKNITNKYGRDKIYTQFIECSSEVIAFELEKGLIKTLRANGYMLCNLADGGEGPSGYKHDRELVERIAQKNRGRFHSEETKARMSAAHTGKSKAPFSEEHKRKLGLNAKGKKWYNNGTNIVFCLEGLQPEGYVLGRKHRTFVKEY